VWPPGSPDLPVLNLYVGICKGERMHSYHPCFKISVKTKFTFDVANIFQCLKGDTVVLRFEETQWGSH
jgi:hypothetical protein